MIKAKFKVATILSFIKCHKWTLSASAAVALN